MRVRRRERGQLLILLGAWLFFGGSAASALLVYDRPVKEVKKAVKRAIADGSRRDSILSYMSMWESIQELQDGNVSADREELLKTLRRKDAQRSDVAPIMAKLDITLGEMDRNFLKLRFHVKEQVTRAEWAEIVARPSP
jgi:predicted nuclease with TOPRIM domain